MGESRTDLMAWLNDLLQLNYTRLEQVGTGAAYCQVIDSIYGDVPLSRCKFNAKQEYEYLVNYKVLQNTFKTHSIDKPIAVDKLIRCKMQDNLEFLQWLKKFWDQNYPGGEYDALGRRRGVPGASDAGPSNTGLNRSARSPVNAVRPTPTAAKRAPPLPRNGSITARVNPSGPDPAMIALTAEMGEIKISVVELEKERDFYFNKLRDIEIIIGARLESGDTTMTAVEEDKLKEMQAILYSTEDGFEVPETDGADDSQFDQGQLPQDEEETF